TVADPKSGLAIAAVLLDRLGAVTDRVVRGARQVYGTAPDRREARLDRVRRRRPGEDIAPGIAGVPQPYVARAQRRATPDRRDEQRPARCVVAGGHVDDEQRTAHRGPCDEPAPQLPHDLGLAAGGEPRSVAHPVPLRAA